jgi:hypothetical protein
MAAEIFNALMIDTAQRHRAPANSDLPTDCR